MEPDLVEIAPRSLLRSDRDPERNFDAFKSRAWASGVCHTRDLHIPASRKPGLGVSGDDMDPLSDMIYVVQTGRTTSQENIMKMTAKHIAPWLAAAGIGAAIVLAPIASADTNPLVPFGSDPHSPYVTGFHVSNHDEANTTNGQLDTPF